MGDREPHGAIRAEVTMPRAGDRIRTARERRRWTQEQLAGAAGISKGFLSDIENDKRNISSESALRLADALGISLDYLVRGESGERERQRRPVSIPPELSKVAEELELSYRDTLTLLEAHEAVVARRSAKLVRPPTVDEWRKLHKAIKDVYPDAAELEK